MKIRFCVPLLLIIFILQLSGCDTVTRLLGEYGSETPASIEAARTESSSESSGAQQPAPEEPAKKDLPAEENAALEEAVQETVPESPEDRFNAEIPEFSDDTLPGYEGIVFVGDSRTLTMASGGKYEYGFLPSDSVNATWGGELTDESAFLNARAAAEKHRKKAVFWYGINDVQLNPQRDNTDVFIDNYKKVLNTYTKLEPDSTIYILSILDTTVREKDHYDGQEENVRRYNEALYRLCLEQEWYYIDITPLLTGDECFVPDDNIHFTREWYEKSFLPYVSTYTGLNIYQN